MKKFIQRQTLDTFDFRLLLPLSKFLTESSAPGSSRDWLHVWENKGKKKKKRKTEEKHASAEWESSDLHLMFHSFLLRSTAFPSSKMKLIYFTSKIPSSTLCPRLWFSLPDACLHREIYERGSSVAVPHVELHASPRFESQIAISQSATSYLTAQNHFLSVNSRSPMGSVWSYGSESEKRSERVEATALLSDLKSVGWVFSWRHVNCQGK